MTVVSRLAFRPAGAVAHAVVLGLEAFATRSRSLHTSIIMNIAPLVVYLVFGLLLGTVFGLVLATLFPSLVTWLLD